MISQHNTLEDACFTRQFCNYCNPKIHWKLILKLESCVYITKSRIYENCVNANFLFLFYFQIEHTRNWAQQRRPEKSIVLGLMLVIYIYIYTMHVFHDFLTGDKAPSSMVHEVILPLFTFSPWYMRWNINIIIFLR